MDLAKSRGWNVFGIDINSEKLDISRRKHGDHVRCCSIYNMDWPVNYFDAIRMCHVLEHLTDPGRALMSLQSILKPGGLLNVGVPVLDEHIFSKLRHVPISGLRKKLIKFMGWIDPPHHLTTWSTQSLDRTLKSCGFEIIWKSYRSDILPWIKGYRLPYILLTLTGVPLSILGSGATVEILANKIS
jgi:ubiquinone/menaquinone biosynthesis C-methylase UbiE